MLKVHEMVDLVGPMVGHKTMSRKKKKPK